MANIDKIIDGKELSHKFIQKTKEQVRENKLELSLAAILIGNDPSSELYIKLKKRACEDCGIDFHTYLIDENFTEEEIIKTIHFLNQDPDTDGILIQLPLPSKFNTDAIIAEMDYRKDIDGFHPTNRDHMSKCQYKLMPPLPSAIIEMINSTGEVIENKNICILCNTPMFGDPFKCVWQNNNKVNVITLQNNWAETTREADILIVAVGNPGLITKNDIKKDAIIIDVGINKVGKEIFGDVDIDDVIDKVKFISPVPGGVGPMTIAMLLKNLIELKSF